MWATMPEELAKGAAYNAMHRAVGDVLAQRGFSVAEAAPEQDAPEAGTVILSAGLSERPAAVHMETEEGKALAPAKRRRLFQACSNRMLRLTVTMVDGTSGKLLYNGSAQEPYCAKATEKVRQQLVSQLAEQAVEDLQTPSGERLINKRKR